MLDWLNRLLHNLLRQASCPPQHLYFMDLLIAPKRHQSAVEPAAQSAAFIPKSAIDIPSHD
jgi:hypothetical protein